MTLLGAPSKLVRHSRRRPYDARGQKRARL